MKKVFRLEDLDCAHCAAKMEEKIATLDGVISVQISFLSQKMTLEVEDGAFDAVLEKAVKICRKIEPDCRIIVK
ncbi:MAG: heavy-metal-associated domain-containing protein [Clostridia bacterium]|nr:heavy-metal-associated domain-containing protein [Clostridia bacterium]